MLLLSQGTVVDGSGADPFVASVLIDGERIVEMGDRTVPDGGEIIDCRGLTIVPGLIDLHSHSDLQVLEGRTEKLKQGVTTEVVGNCGFSPFPCTDADALRGFAAGILGDASSNWGWPSAASYLQRLAEAGAAERAIPLIGHGSLRIAVHGLGQDALTQPELHQMCGLLADCLEAGCAGLSTGLMYAPGSAANDDELSALCEVVASKDKLYASHIRGYGKTLLEAVREQIELAEESGCRLQISHLQAAGRENWHLQAQALEQIEEAHVRGVDVEFDIYPYQCGSTVLTQLLPQWALDGGIPALLRRIGEAKSPDAILGELRARESAYWSDVTISSVDSIQNAAVIGQTMAQAAKLRNCCEAEFVLDLLAEEKGAVNIVTFNQSESNLRQLITHRLCSVITDGFYVKGKPHPRLHGTYPELLGKLVRDCKWLTLPEAIHKSSAQPAKRINAKEYGLLRPGSLADITVFDLNTISSHSTYEMPQREPQGFAFVFKRGKQLFKGGQA